MSQELDLREVTIISQVPFELNERKPCYPSSYIIPAAPWRGISTLIVKEAHCFVYVDSNRGSIKIPLAAPELATSIINDFTNAVLASSKDARPGLFHVNGGWTTEKAEKEFTGKIAEYRKYQVNWFKALVRMADDDWQKTRQLKSISDLQRAAAKFLDIDKPWLEMIPEEQTQCPACFTVVDSRAVVCNNCQCILDTEKYNKMTFVKAPMSSPALTSQVGKA